MISEVSLNDDAHLQIGISTADAETIISITKNQLDKYQRKGIVSPYRSGPSPQAMHRWTLEQVWMASNIPKLISQGLSVDEVKRLVAQGMDPVYERLRTAHLYDTRYSRRMLKSIVLYESARRDCVALGRQEGSYLRHIPERWFALAPLGPGTSFDGLMRRTVAILGVAQSVGWCATKITGFLKSVSADGKSFTDFAFIQLASPPMPTYTGARMVDGGCYHAFDKEGASLRCDEPDCKNCSRFGRNPTKREIFEWRGEADRSPWLWDRTVMAADIEKPYASGVWAQYTRERLAQGHPFFPTQRDEIETGPALRPYLMPHETKLPFGVTACVLPLGTYLCSQSSESIVQSDMQRFLGQASVFKQRPYTEDEEVSEAVMRIKQRGFDSVENGPVMEHFAQSRTGMDDQQANWSYPIERSDLSRLVLPTSMALVPEDGYCVICSAVPVADRNDIPELELQLLVDCTDVAAPPN